MRLLKHTTLHLIKQKQFNYTDDGLYNLAQAILAQTCKDYVRAIKGIYRYRSRKYLNSDQYACYMAYYRDKKDIELFYGSQRFKLLTLQNNSMTSKEIIDAIIKKYKLEKYL